MIRYLKGDYKKQGSIFISTPEAATAAGGNTPILILRAHGGTQTQFYINQIGTIDINIAAVEIYTEWLIFDGIVNISFMHGSIVRDSFALTQGYQVPPNSRAYNGIYVATIKVNILALPTSMPPFISFYAP